MVPLGQRLDPAADLAHRLNSWSMSLVEESWFEILGQPPRGMVDRDQADNRAVVRFYDKRDTAE